LLLHKSAAEIWELDNTEIIEWLAFLQLKAQPKEETEQ